MATSYIILVNWNGHRDTIECLESLLRLDETDFHIVVVDNGSEDGSVPALECWAKEISQDFRTGRIWDDLWGRRRLAPEIRRIDRLAVDRAPLPTTARITLIEAAANLGFAAANNLGMRLAARDPGARYFWVLNNDTVVRPDALSALLGHAEKRREQSIIGTTLLYYHSPDLVQGLGGWIRPARAIAGHIGFGLAANQLPPADDVNARLGYVMGASMFVRRDLYDRIGGMSEDYFLYFEELDWAKRLPSGDKQGVCLEAVVFHKEGGSIGTDSLNRPSDTSIYYLSVNTVRYYWRYERRYVAVALARTIWNMAAYARRGDWAAIDVTCQAIADAARGRKRSGPYNGPSFKASGAVATGAG